MKDAITAARQAVADSYEFRGSPDNEWQDWEGNTTRLEDALQKLIDAVDHQ